MWGWNGAEWAFLPHEDGTGRGGRAAAALGQALVREELGPGGEGRVAMRAAGAVVGDRLASVDSPLSLNGGELTVQADGLFSRPFLGCTALRSLSLGLLANVSIGRGFFDCVEGDKLEARTWSLAIVRLIFHPLTTQPTPLGSTPAGAKSKNDRNRKR